MANIMEKLNWSEVLYVVKEENPIARKYLEEQWSGLWSDMEEIGPDPSLNVISCIVLQDMEKHGIVVRARETLKRLETRDKLFEQLRQTLSEMAEHGYNVQVVDGFRHTSNEGVATAALQNGTFNVYIW